MGADLLHGKSSTRTSKAAHIDTADRKSTHHATACAPPQGGQQIPADTISAAILPRSTPRANPKNMPTITAPPEVAQPPQDKENDANNSGGALDLAAISPVLNAGFRAVLEEAGRLGVLDPPYGRTPVPDPEKITEDRHNQASDTENDMEGEADRIFTRRQGEESRDDPAGLYGGGAGCLYA